MIKVYLDGHRYNYPICDVLQLFFGASSYDEVENVCTAPMMKYPKGGTGSAVAEERATRNTDEVIFHSRIRETHVRTECENNPALVRESITEPEKVKREIKRQLYFLLATFCEREYPWGSLTGIRPTQVAAETMNPEHLTEFYGVRPQMAALAVETAQAEEDTLLRLSPGGVVTYIGIPFCKSRCSYCSFICSESTTKEKLMAEYSRCLVREVTDFFESGYPHPLDAVYVGGGTPTVFEDAAFEHLMRELHRVLSAYHPQEITVEAGRADTVTAPKLRILHELGVDRICINPQTLHDQTLAAIGRNHSRDDFYRAYALARETGFRTINTDIIAGLPGETEQMFAQTLDGILRLQPENITVHTLSAKRASRLTQTDAFQSGTLEAVTVIEHMVDLAHKTLQEAGYRPYYLYRQKGIMGGHENTGYTKPGHACLYNVAMMSDKSSVIGFGAGMSKRVFPQNRLERCPSPKNPDDYIRRIHDIIEKKKDFFKHRIKKEFAL